MSAGPQLTPSQTVGPFFRIGLTWDEGELVVPEGTPGALRIQGHVHDGAGDVVPDALVECWQCDPDGRFADPGAPGGASTMPGFRGFARAGTDDDGRWSVLTVRPGPAAPGEAPHIAVSVLARGLLRRLATRIYLPDEEEANAADPVLSSVPAERRETLIARPDGDALRFDIRLQGPGETVFFDV